MNKKQRLVIYCFYDKDGIADRYIDYFLKGLTEVTSKFVIVVNGKITPEARQLFLKYTDDIFVRPNKGLDICAYKYALEKIGWDTLRTYYEVCLVNATVMGPVYPFKEMFDKMDERQDLDFWGITRYLKVETDPFGCNPYGYLPEHVQSYFCVYRNKFLKAKELAEYWKNLPEIKNYNDAVGKHESFFTKHFEDMGFIWSTYIHNEEEEKYSPYYLLYNPKQAIEKDRCPVFKKRSFFHDADIFLGLTSGEQSIELFNYLKENTNYDVDMITENIIRTTNQYNIAEDLGLVYILPTKMTLNYREQGEYDEKTKSQNNEKIALIMHLYYMDLLENSVHYASAMPSNADIYITTPHENEIPVIQKAFSVLPNKVEVRLIPNRGRDVSSLVCGVADIINNYEYACFYHDKKVKQIENLGVGRSFAYVVSESVLHNRKYVNNIIETFREKPQLGLLTPLPPYHSQYFETLGGEWGNDFINFENTVDLAKKLNLNVSIDKNKPPIAPLGTVFWFRPKAMRKLYDYSWKFDDFPKEPNGIDGTLLHAFERVYSYVIQDAGYYPAYVRPDYLAGLDLMNLMHYLREINVALRHNSIYGPAYYKAAVLESSYLSRNGIPFTLRHRGGLMKTKKALKRILPYPLYIMVLKMKRLIIGPRNLPTSINN